MISSLNQKFLLVDDDQVYGSIMAQSARRENIGLDVCSSLLEIDPYASPREYSAVILDYDLGNLKGFEVVSYLTALYGDLPILLISSTNRDDVTNWPTNIKTFICKQEGNQKILSEAMSLTAI